MTLPFPPSLSTNVRFCSLLSDRTHNIVGETITMVELTISGGSGGPDLGKRASIGRARQANADGGFLTAASAGVVAIVTSSPDCCGGLDSPVLTVFLVLILNSPQMQVSCVQPLDWTPREFDCLTVQYWRCGSRRTWLEGDASAFGLVPSSRRSEEVGLVIGTYVGHCIPHLRSFIVIPVVGCTQVSSPCFRAHPSQHRVSPSSHETLPLTCRQLCQIPMNSTAICSSAQGAFL